MMLAYRLAQAQKQPEFQEVPEPHAGPGQVVVRVAGSGLCHTDLTVRSRDRNHWGDEPPPFTLGHEIAGWIEEVGTGVTRFQRGDTVAVNPSWASCGRCHLCRSGEENHCLYQKAIRAPGVGYDGGHAPYVLVPEARFLVPIGDLDPIKAAPLTDAGITTYSAIKSALPGIWPGSTAVVIGVGGLGIYAVQFLRLLTGARIVAVDSTDARLKLARQYGADDVEIRLAAHQGAPALPLLSIVYCLVLMLSLPLETWIRFFVWLIVGLTIYYFFGRKHSELAVIRT